MRRQDSAFAVIMRRDRVLLVKGHGKRHWQLPGGGVEESETPVTTVHREIHEETGLRARVLGFTGIYRRPDASLVFVFAARVRPQDEPRGPRFEILKQRWVRVAKATRLLARKARRFLEDAVRRPSLLRARRTPREWTAIHLRAG